MSDALTIDTASNILGVCKQTLRRWDDNGKLTAVRSDSGYRLYELSEILKLVPSDKARPFLKWAGGKSQLLPELLPRVPNNYHEYAEPFLGGGALFFALQPKRAKLNDINEDLINTYLQVRDNIDDVLELLSKHQKNHSEAYYYEIRSKAASRMKPVNKAARFIYLNKTCFNGLHRVNKKGEFNVPIGSYKNPKILDSQNLIACSNALESTELYCLDFRDFIKIHVKKKSFVYIDPPYIPVSEYSDFDRYAKGKFRVGSQLDLASEYSKLVDKGVYVLLSNSSSELSSRLYSDFKMKTVQAGRSINKDAQKRGKIEEIIVQPHRTSSPKFPSTRFMGSKTTLLPYIAEMLGNEKRGQILDAFSGSGVVSYQFKKMGFEVISNDFLHYSSSVAIALIENSKVRLQSEDIDLLLQKNRKAGKFVQKTFKDLYFLDDDNKFLDNTVANIEMIDCIYKKSLARAALSRACLKRRPRGLFTYVGFKYDDGRKDLTFSLKEHFIFSINEFNKAVFDNGKNNKAFNQSILNLDLNTRPEIVYLDPPYFSKHSDNDYVRRYHFIEGLSRNWKGIEIQEQTKTKKFLKYPSPFDTSKGAYAAFEELFSKYKKSKILISYSSNSLPEKNEIIAMLKNEGKTVQVKSIDYKYSAGTHGHKVNRNNNDVHEYLFLAQ